VFFFSYFCTVASDDENGSMNEDSNPLDIPEDIDGEDEPKEGISGTRRDHSEIEEAAGKADMGFVGRFYTCFILFYLYKVLP